MALTSLCSLSVCYPARPQAVQKVVLALELPPRYLSFAVLFISLWKKQASLDNFFGKSAHVSILKTSHRRRLQLFTSLTSRTDQYFAFLFCSVLHHCRLTFEALEYICMYAREYLCALRYVFANMQIIIVLVCNKYQIRPRKILQN